MESRHINAVGIWLYSKSTKRYLYLLRNDPKHPGAWGLAGGKADRGESLSQTIRRECTEELGAYPDVQKLIPIEHFTSADTVSYTHLTLPTNREV